MLQSPECQKCGAPLKYECEYCDTEYLSTRTEIEEEEQPEEETLIEPEEYTFTSDDTLGISAATSVATFFLTIFLIWIFGGCASTVEPEIVEIEPTTYLIEDIQVEYGNLKNDVTFRMFLSKGTKIHIETCSQDINNQGAFIDYFEIPGISWTGVSYNYNILNNFEQGYRYGVTLTDISIYIQEQTFPIPIISYAGDHCIMNELNP